MADIFGFDFGTTNSLAARVVEGESLALVSDEGRPHPSVVWFHGGEVIVGQEAKRRLAEPDAGVGGDVIRSPKRLLGSEDTVHIGGAARTPSEIVAHVLRLVHEDAEGRMEPFDRVVMCVPVTMQGRGRRQLREAALLAGIHIEQFVHEPLAALYGYLRPQADFRRKLAELDRQLALVVDWGGGTLDLTLCTVVNGCLVQVQNVGNDLTGGDRFDELLLHEVRRRHLEQYGLSGVTEEVPGARAALMEQCEAAKIDLSQRSSATVFLDNFLRSNGEERTLEVVLTRHDLVSITRELVEDGLSSIDRLLEGVHRTEASIGLCVATGGMVQMPYIQERLIERFGIERLARPENGDRVIAQGAAWIAHDELELTLAKPFEVLHADENYHTVIDERTTLPRENKVQPYGLGMYCVDPRDGFARFMFARPVWPGHALPTDERREYATLRVAVDETAAPLRERLEVVVTLDDALIATVRTRSSLLGDERSTEIHDLEFGLIFTDEGVSGDPDLHEVARRQPPGSVQLRSNITDEARAWRLVPGEIVERYRPGYFSAPNRPLQRQHDERMYYSPCSWCGRTIDRINVEGCTRPECRVPSPDQAMVAAERRAYLLAALDRDDPDLGHPPQAL